MTSAVIWRDRENYRGAGGDFFFSIQNCLGAICRDRKSHRFPTPGLQKYLCSKNVSSPPHLFPANGAPTLPPPASQKERDGVSEKPSGGEAFSRPRPVSFRAKPHTWALLRGRNKSYSLGHFSGEKTAQNLSVVLSSEVGMGCSLLDMDTEGQKRDCTVPLCRIQSSPGRTSVFELEKEFLS